MDKNEIQRDKESRFFSRTISHIHSVQRSMLTLVTKYRDVLGLEFPDCRRLIFQVMIHDQTKFDSYHCRPYVEITEYHYQRRVLGNITYDYPKELWKLQVDEVISSHYVNENHHPERMVTPYCIMTNLQLIETCCDLQAMAEEYGEGSCRTYFENVWLKKHEAKFKNDFKWASKKALMNKVIECFEDNIKDTQKWIN